MKRIALPLLMFLLACSAATVAQNKIDNTTNQVDKTNSTINSANSTVTTTGETAQNLKSTITSLFGGKKEKKKADSTGVVPGESVHFNITNVDYNTLKKLEDNVKTVKGVKGTTKKFNPGGSTLDVTFKGKSDEVWDAIPETIRNLFELQDLDDSTITLDMKAK
jgi:hypothetical protein